MNKIGFYYYDLTDKRFYRIELMYLRPRSYMIGDSFDRLFKYIRKELSYQCDWITNPLEQISSIYIRNNKEHWEDSIKNPNFKYNECY